MGRYLWISVQITAIAVGQPMKLVIIIDSEMELGLDTLDGASYACFLSPSQTHADSRVCIFRCIQTLLQRKLPYPTGALTARMLNLRN